MNAWLAAAGVPVSRLGGEGRPAIVYVIVGILGIVAVYLLIRLLVWDRVNKATPNQEEPLFRDPKEPFDGTG